MKDKRLNSIIEILVDELHPKKLILFGSRGKGMESYNSGYDIAIDSDKIDFTAKRKLKEKIIEVSGLYKIDIVYLSETDEGFKDIILTTGKIIYEN